MVGNVSSHVLTILLTVSYLALGVFHASAARALWWQFAVAVLILTTLNLLFERRRR